jgi:translation initiation factor eIF-2B subunit epsilon
VPLIDYTLDWLWGNNINDVHIYCGNHADKLENYLEASLRWSSRSKGRLFNSITVYRLPSVTSVGDVMRDLDKRGVIQGDFVLVHGDLVASVDIGDAYDAHVKRREADPTAIMTMVLMDHPDSAKPQGLKPIFIVDNNNKNRCLAYDEINPLARASDQKLFIDKSVLEMSDDFEIISDFIDPGIDICTPEVLGLWSDSFDYALPRRHFLHGVLKDWELNNKTIYVEIPRRGYAVRANNLQQYDAISQNMLLELPDPYIPRRNIFSDQQYQQNICPGSLVELQSFLGRSCRLERSVVGQGSVLGDGCNVSRSIIGRDCCIGDNVTIEDSYIWPGVTVRSNTKVTRSIIGGGTIGQGCTIGPGCVLASGVIIGDGVTVEKDLLVSTLDDSGSSLPTDPTIVGRSGTGAAFVDPSFEDLDSRDPAHLQRSLIYSIANFSISEPSVSSVFGGSTEDSDDEDTHRLPGTSGRGRHDSFMSEGSFAADFVLDASQGLLEALRDDTGDFEAAKMEFQGLRFGSDASEADIRRAVAVAFARRTAELLTEGLVPNKAAEETLKNIRGVPKFISEVAIAGDGDDVQAEFALALQKALVAIKGLEVSRAGVLLQAMLQQLYGLEVVEEGGILGWWNDERSQAGGGMEDTRAKCQALVNWLEQDDDDDDEDDDDDDE